ncbi:MAG TPA: zf-HC2 domain-containing protein [Planctomycetota bacterium]
MTCGEVNEVLDLYLDGELEAERRPALEAHAGRCAACARQVEKRRALSGALRGAFDRSLEGAEPRGGERERTVEGMAKTARRRLVFPARLAAAAVIGVTVGLVAYAMGLSRATPEELEVAESLRGREARGAQIRQLRTEAAADLEFVRGAAEPEKRQDPAALVLNVAASTIARRLEKDLTPPPDPAAAKEKRVVVKNTVDGAAVEVVQMGDGRVTLVVPGRTIEAPSMAELQKRHGELCRKFGVQGREGAVRVGESVAATDLKGQLHLIWRTGIWDEDVQWEAARTWLSVRVPDAAEMEKRIRELRDRCKAASAPAAAPEVKIDLAALLAEVKGRSRRELEETRVRVEREMKRLESELEDLRELRGRAKGLRLFAESVAEPAKK